MPVLSAAIRTALVVHLRAMQLKPSAQYLLTHLYTSSTALLPCPLPKAAGGAAFVPESLLCCPRGGRHYALGIDLSLQLARALRADT